MKVVDSKRLEGAMPCCRGVGVFCSKKKEEVIGDGGEGNRLESKKREGDGGS